MQDSLFRGVSWHRAKKKWEARIAIGGVKYYLSDLKDEEAAACAFDKAVMEHGLSDRLNYDYDDDPRVSVVAVYGQSLQSGEPSLQFDKHIEVSLRLYICMYM
jgi:hypothetical protein